jgi:hypothetical protein
MHRITRIKGKSATTAVMVLLLASLGLAACGGSSKGPTTSASVAAAGTTTGGSTSTQSGSTTTTGATSTNSGSTSPTGGSPPIPGGSTSKGGPAGGRAGRFAVVRECLQKNGITLPKPTPGKPGSGFLGGTPTLPKGVTRAQYQAALKKCGGAAFTGVGRLNTPAFKEEIAKFAACMRANGVNVPAPNASGKGPIFSTKGLNPNSAQFKAAESKCSAELGGRFLRRGPRTGGPPAGAPAVPGG